MFKLKQLDIEKDISKFQIKNPESEIISLTKLQISNGLLKKLQSNIRYENVNIKPLINEQNTGKQMEILQKSMKTFEHKNFGEQYQKERQLELVNNYGNVKIYSDIPGYECQILPDKHKILQGVKRLNKIKQKIARKKVQQQKWEEHQAKEIQKNIHGYLYEQNKKYMKLREQDFEYMEQKHNKLNQQYEHQKLLEMEKEFQFQDLETQQQQKKRKLNRELQCIYEGINYKSAKYDLRDNGNGNQQDQEDQVIKNNNKIIPKSQYVENINENLRKFPMEENIVYVSQIPRLDNRFRFIRSIPQMTQFDVDSQNIYKNYVIKIKNILWFLRQHMQFPHDFDKISGNLKLPIHKLKVLFDMMNKSQGLELKYKLKQLNKRKNNSQEYLKQTLFPELRDCFKAILKPYLMSNNYEIVFPQNETYINLEQLRDFLYEWDYHSFQ